MSDVEYDLKSVQLPRLAGLPLHLMTALLESPATRWLLMGSLTSNAGLDKFRSLEVDEPPTLNPTAPFASQGDGRPPPDLAALARGAHAAAGGFSFATVADYAEAYRSGRVTPEEVAASVLDAMAASDRGSRPLRAFVASSRDDVLAQARASTQRHRAGSPLSVFDGVPVAVKDEVDQVPYPTTVGTRFLGGAPAREDSTVVARMRAAGALLIGKTNMHEIGIGVTGLNPHHGTVRNPYHPGHYTGGSSSGSAAAVAAGLCPVAIGADGGGSIRIPSAFCGAVGLKPTFGRVSEFGAAPLCWSVAHLGPIAATARDAALAYAVIAGPDARDPGTLRQPAVTLDRFDDLDLSGLKLGVYRPWFNHAAPSLVAACQAMLRALEACGAQVREIEVPGLEAARLAHLIAISGEMTVALDRYHARHRRDYGLEVRVNLALARSFTARDYIKAQQVRTRAMRAIAQLFEEVDVIVTPTTGCPAPPIPGDALPDGESDLATLTEIMRYVYLANLTGCPAISFPAGYDEAGLPLGFHAMGRPWAEDTLLRLANAAGNAVERRQPQLYYQVLPRVEP